MKSKTRFLPSIFLLNIIVKVLVSTFNKQRKKEKMKRTGKGRKMLLFADSIISARKFNRICRQTFKVDESSARYHLEYLSHIENIVTIEP